MAIDTSRVLVTHEQIEEMLERLSAQLNRDYAGKHLVVVGILTGAFIFTSDLIRRLTMPVTVDFMQVSSYVGEISSGVLKIKKDLSYDIEGKDVLIVICAGEDGACIGTNRYDGTSVLPCKIHRSHHQLPCNPLSFKAFKDACMVDDHPFRCCAPIGQFADMHIVQPRLEKTVQFCFCVFNG